MSAFDPQRTSAGISCCSREADLPVANQLSFEGNGTPLRQICGTRIESSTVTMLAHSGYLQHALAHTFVWASFPFRYSPQTNVH